jgi:cobalt-zinc-cadmium efflux system outer membrane protein
VPPVDPEVLQRRPDVTAAEARLAAAASARDLARAGRVPDVTVGAQYEHYPVSEANTTGSGNSYGVFVSIPLFVRHSFGGEARRAEVDYYAALDDRNRVLLEAQNDIGRLRSQLELARASLQQMRPPCCRRPKASRRAPSSPIRRVPPACWTCSTRAARCARRAGRRRRAGQLRQGLAAYRAALQATNSDINKLPQVRTDASHP